MLAGVNSVTEDAMPKPLVDDELWEAVEPLLPGHEPRPKGGKPPSDDRVCLTGILFVLKTGIAWEDFPCEMGCCGTMKLSCRAIATAIARRNAPHGSGLGVFRWFVEQALALMHQFKRLRVRDDRDDKVHEAFMTIACAMVCWRRLHS